MLSTLQHTWCMIHSFQGHNFQGFNHVPFCHAVQVSLRLAPLLATSHLFIPEQAPEVHCTICLFPLPSPSILFPWIKSNSFNCLHPPLVPRFRIEQSLEENGLPPSAGVQDPELQLQEPCSSPPAAFEWAFEDFVYWSYRNAPHI